MLVVVVISWSQHPSENALSLKISHISFMPVSRDTRKAAIPYMVNCLIQGVMQGLQARQIGLLLTREQVGGGRAAQSFRSFHYVKIKQLHHGCKPEPSGQDISFTSIC